SGCLPGAGTASRIETVSECIARSTMPAVSDGVHCVAAAEAYLRAAYPSIDIVRRASGCAIHGFRRAVSTISANDAARPADVVGYHTRTPRYRGDGPAELVAVSGNEVRAGSATYRTR